MYMLFPNVVRRTGNDNISILRSVYVIIDATLSRTDYLLNGEEKRGEFALLAI